MIVSVLDHGKRSKPDVGQASGLPRVSGTAAPQEPPDWLAVLRRMELREIRVPELDEASRRQIIRGVPRTTLKACSSACGTRVGGTTARRPCITTSALQLAGEGRHGDFEPWPVGLNCAATTLRAKIE